MRITVAAPAKVNLWLRVGPRKADGYHPISSLFCALDLADTVVVREPGGDDDPLLKVTHAPPLRGLPELGPLDDNLAARAARAFMTRAGLEEQPRVRLVKRIPPGGGLGGGSSDAAAVLRALRRLYPDALDGPAIEELGRRLGSDVPFFLLGTPLAHGAGRGDELIPLQPLPPRPVVVVMGGFPIATADAYAWIDDDRRATGDPDGASIDLDPALPPDGALAWEAVIRRARNDFEGPVFDRYPPLRQLRDALRDHGAEIALLAGSGSTVVGVFETAADAEAAADSVRALDRSLRVVVTAARAR